LLTDVGLPDGSGLQIIATLRGSSAAPAVAMSGFGMESDVARAPAAGFAEHLTNRSRSENCAICWADSPDPPDSWGWGAVCPWCQGRFNDSG